MPFLLLLFLQNFAMTAAKTTIVALNLTEGKGQICVSLYDSKENFMNPSRALHVQIVPVTSKGTLEIRLPDCLPGRYAIALFHDLNSNGKLDTNLLGIPTEPYGFSQNVRPRFRAARWEEATVALTSGENSLEIRLETW